MISGEFCAERLLYFSVAETKSQQLQILKESWVGNSCDSLADNTGLVLPSRGNRKIFSWNAKCLSCKEYLGKSSAI